MRVRRVVTGHDARGKAVVVNDSPVEPVTATLTGESEFHVLWGADSVRHFPDDGSPPPHVSYFPPVGGFRFGLFSVPPEGRSLPADLDLESALAEFDAKLPGLASHIEPDAPGMHTTATIDYEVVLEGEVWLELDDGVEVHLRAGDTVVQNGTRHAWRNHGSETARLAVVLIGADHDQVPPSAR